MSTGGIEGYRIPERGHVSLEIYNIVGQRVTTLVNEMVEAGTYKVNFKAVNLHSGVYFCRLETGCFVDVKKMILLK